MPVVTDAERTLLARLLLLGYTGPRPENNAWELFTRYPPSGILLFKHNITSQDALAVVLREVQERCGGGLLVGIDQEGGRVVRLTPEVGFPIFPAARAIAQAPDPVQAATHAACVTARGLKALGINVDFAPVLDVVTDPDNRVIGDRSYGSTPNIVTELGLAVVGALQGEGVAATVKHFPGHGPTAVDSHLDLPLIAVGREELDQIHLPPFAAALKAGAAACMTAHAVYQALDPELPATLSPLIIQGLLRSELGFEGLVMTDSLTMQAIARRWTVPEACVMAVEAGVDLLMVPSQPALQRRCLDALCAAFESGRLTRSRVEQSLWRIDRVRRQYAIT